MRQFWLFRLLFFGGLLLSIGLVVFTISSRRQGPARAEPARPRIPLERPRQVSGDSIVLSTGEGATSLASRVRIVAVIPYRREVHVYNFGDAAEDVSGWRLASPRANGEDSYRIPIGLVLLPNDLLIVVVDEGIDQPGLLYWRVPGDRRVLELASDTIILYDEAGSEVSRFAYSRR